MTRRALLMMAAVAWGCTPDAPPPETSPRAAPVTPLFVERAADVGLVFNHDAGARGEFLFPEIMGGGGALIDYDRDGDLDIYLVQSGTLAVGVAAPPDNRLYRNLMIEEGALRFADATAGSGTGDRGYGMGAAVGDIDGDGWPDLYVTNVGSNRLYRNNHDGTFADVTAEWGADDERWSTSASFVDVDADDDDDLIVVNYVQFSVAGNVTCSSQAGAPDYCAPATYSAAPDRLFRNDGGHFVDVTHEAGLDAAYGNGLGVAIADFNDDGRVDIYVANDQTPNNLWLARGQGRFEEDALMAGVAYNDAGAVEASMGVTAADIDGDADVDLFMSHLHGETNTLYLNQGAGRFVDATARLGLAASSLPLTGFGTRFFDVEGDGDLDLFIANGAVTVDPARIGESGYPFSQDDQLFLQQADGRFSDASDRIDAAPQAIGRGALFGDLDNDGDIDIVVINNNGPVHFLRNEAPHVNGWLGVTPVDENGRALRARVARLDSQGPTLWREAGRDGSYLSSADPRVTLPADTRVVDILVVWENGNKERWGELTAGRYHTLRRGSGSRWPSN